MPAVGTKGRRPELHLLRPIYAIVLVGGQYAGCRDGLRPKLSIPWQAVKDRTIPAFFWLMAPSPQICWRNLTRLTTVCSEGSLTARLPAQRADTSVLSDDYGSEPSRDTEARTRRGGIAASRRPIVGLRPTLAAVRLFPMQSDVQTQLLFLLRDT